MPDSPVPALAVSPPVAQALARIQQVLLSQGYQYLYGDDAAWPASAVMMAKADSAVVVSPFPSQQLSGSLPLDKPGFALLLVGAGSTNEIEGFARSHPGNIAFFNPQLGRWFVQGHHGLFEQRLLTLYSSQGFDPGLNRYDCRALLREARENPPVATKEHVFKPAVTIALIGVCVAIYFLGQASAVRDLACYGPAIKAGEYWRLITCAFVHGGEIHLFFNMMALWYFGRQVELLQGWWRMLVFFLASVLAGSIVSLFVHETIFHSVENSVGASGGLFGLAGVIAGMVIRHRHVLPAGVGKAMLRSIAAFLVYNLVFLVPMFFQKANVGMPRIDVAAHAGGLIGGFLWALAISCPPLRFGPLSMVEKVLAIVLTAVLVAAAAVVIYYLPIARI